MPLGATYRVQLQASFGFHDAAGIARYLAALGISHLYCSPILQAQAGSTHGYDVVDHSRLSEELGGAAGFGHLVEVLHDEGLGLMVDIVPNHMARDGRANRWWWDVLENGPASRYAAHFDIDWTAGGAVGAFRVLVPILQTRYGEALRSGDLALRREGGRVVLTYRDAELPVSPRSLAELLTAAARRCGAEKLAALARAHAELPDSRFADRLAIARRHDEKERLAGELAALCDAEPPVASAVEHELAALAREPEGLDALLLQQNYRLAYWGVANEALDSRRFLDIGELVALRVEDDNVFTDTHALVLELVRRGDVDALRVDHVDGLADPESYLLRLRRSVGDAPVLVEKVLLDDEALRDTWPVEGSTGYDFLATVNGLFVDAEQGAAFLECYEAFVDERVRFDDVVWQAKADLARTEFASDLERLVEHALEACERTIDQRDRTRGELRGALIGLLCGFRVYRTYLAPERPAAAEDLMRVAEAVDAASAQPGADGPLLAFLGELLRLEHASNASTRFVRSFQQLCAAVEAKGLEDTAGYRYLRLCSLNEVGSDPGRFGASPEEFHALCARIADRWPSTLLTLETHDTKRSADARARLNVLSELPTEWRALLGELDAAAARFRPALLDRNTEYLIAQSVIAVWPATADRLAAYVRKATKEAKLATSWSSADGAYDDAVEDFVRTAVIDPGYRGAIASFLERTGLVTLGRRTSLAQTTLLLTAPGVPDLYQGSERWHLALVDPDNRRAVDFPRLSAMLAELGDTPPPLDLADDHEGLHKLFVVKRLLRHRAQRASSMPPCYEPISASGERASRLVAFSRGDLVVAVPRLVAGLADGWGTTTLRLPDGTWRDVLTGAVRDGDVPVDVLLADAPVAVLEPSGGS